MEYTDPFSKMRVGRTYLTRPNLKFYQTIKEVYDSEISVAGDQLVGYELILQENENFSDEK